MTIAEYNMEQTLSKCHWNQKRNSKCQDVTQTGGHHYVDAVKIFHTHHSDITFQAINLLKRREVRNNSVNYDKLLSLQLDYLRRSSCEIFDIMPQLENN